MNTITPDKYGHTSEILDTLIAENDRRLELVKRTSAHSDVPSYIFRGALAPEDDDEEWVEKTFDTEAKAREWMKLTRQKRARAKRVTYSYPVTIEKGSGSFGGRAAFNPALLKGINATDGEWRIKYPAETKTHKRTEIYRRMDPNDATEAAILSDEIAERETKLRGIKNKYNLDLPGRSYGRLKVDEAVEFDEQMVRVFERHGVGEETS